MNTRSLDAVFVPPARPPGEGDAGHLMVVLHGRGDSREGFAWLPEALGFPGMAYLMVNAPDDYHGGFSWYDLPPDQEPGIQRSRRALDALFAETAEAGYPPSQTFVFGFSQGCLMSWEWGGRFPRSLAGIVGISGYVFDPDQLVLDFTSAAKATPRLITHGHADGVLPYDESRRQADQLAAAGIPFEWKDYPKDHTILPNEIADIRAWIAGLI